MLLRPFNSEENKNISIILASSTIIIFSLALLNSSIPNADNSLFHFKNLCIVYPGAPTASVILLALLPVGASNAISLDSTPSFFFNISTIALIIVVLPVPGPPVII